MTPPQSPVGVPYPPIEVGVVFAMGVVAALIAFAVTIFLGYYLPARRGTHVAPEYVLLYVIAGVGITLLSNPAWIRPLVITTTGDGSATYVVSLALFVAGFVVYCILFILGAYWLWQLYTPGGPRPPKPPRNWDS